ncbi:MAG: substrate-binding periplasmic protein [Micrococcaceae bacterium]
MLTKNISAGVYTTATVGIASLLLVGCSADAGTTDGASDCTPATEGLTTINAGTLTVGVPENMPYTKNEDSDADGFEIDLLRAIAEEECLNLQFEVITYANGIPMITAQRSVDMISGGWYITPERAQQVDFTSPTFYDSMAIISEDGATTVDKLEDMSAVGSVAGFSWEGDMSGVLGSKMKTYPSTIETRQDLVSGRLEGALDGYAVATFAYGDTDYAVEIAEPDDRIAITTDQPQIGFPVSKDNPELTEALSTLIDQYREDGTLASILADWDLPEDLVVPADVAEQTTNG